MVLISDNRRDLYKVNCLGKNTHLPHLATYLAREGVRQLYPKQSSSCRPFS